MPPLPGELLRERVGAGRRVVPGDEELQRLRHRRPDLPVAGVEPGLDQPLHAPPATVEELPHRRLASAARSRRRPARPARTAARATRRLTVGRVRGRLDLAPRHRRVLQPARLRGARGDRPAEVALDQRAEDRVHLTDRVGVVHGESVAVGRPTSTASTASIACTASWARSATTASARDSSRIAGSTSRTGVRASTGPTPARVSAETQRVDQRADRYPVAGRGAAPARRGSGRRPSGLPQRDQPVQHVLHPAERLLVRADLGQRGGRRASISFARRASTVFNGSSAASHRS